MNRLDALISDEDTGPEYDWLRSHNFTFKTWQCTKCPDNAVCNGTTDGKGNVGKPLLSPAGCTETCRETTEAGYALGQAGQQESSDCSPCISKVCPPAPPYPMPEYWAPGRSCIGHNYIDHTKKGMAACCPVPKA